MPLPDQFFRYATRALPSPVKYALHWGRTRAGRRAAGRCLQACPGGDIIHQFQRDRGSQAYQAPFTESNPLVSLTITTYNRWELLSRRALPSALKQDYPNLEIIIVGDGCTDDTERGMAQVRDSRVRFVNLPQRGSYPEEPYLRWLVAGTAPANRALALATGRFVTHLDHDDEQPPDRISKLMQVIQRERCDLVWHPFYRQTMSGEWLQSKPTPFAAGLVTSASTLYHGWFLRIPFDPHVYRYRQPGDWNRLAKFHYLGAKMMCYREPLLWHYRDHNPNSR